MMVVALNHKTAPGATEATVLGPFFAHGAKEYGYGGDLREGATMKGEDVWVSGRVLSVDGKPIAGAALDIWQAKADGIYDLQTEGEFELRGRVKANAKGEYAFASYKPKFYSIPMDGPVGDLVRATSNNHMRPAHMHAIVSAPGYQQVITHVFVDGDPYLDGDAVFAVKNSLVGKYKKVNDAAEAKKRRPVEPVPQARIRLPPLARQGGREESAQEDRRQRRGRMIWRVRRVADRPRRAGPLDLHRRRPGAEREGDVGDARPRPHRPVGDEAARRQATPAKATPPTRPVHLEPPKNGTILRIVEFPPDSAWRHAHRRQGRLQVHRRRPRAGPASPTR